MKRKKNYIKISFGFILKNIKNMNKNKAHSKFSNNNKIIENNLNISLIRKIMLKS